MVWEGEDRSEHCEEEGGFPMHEARVWEDWEEHPWAGLVEVGEVHH